MQTNIYTAEFSVTTNASDADADVVTLFAVTSACYGSVSNDPSCLITYERNAGNFGDDRFTYVVTDGKGGSAVGNVLVQQVDTSGVGIPDQWLIEYGMDPDVDNSLNDPDGDILPNLAEFLLGTNPNHADNPLNLPTLTNGTTMSGFVKLPLAGIDPKVPAPAVTLLVDGNPAANVSLTHGPDRAWFLNWDTTHLANDSYSIQVAFHYNPSALSNFVYGTEKTVVIDNPLIFDSLSDKFGNFLLIDATVAMTNADYTVQLYDDYGDLLVWTSGTTTNGQIQLYWDLPDGQGNQISFGNIQAVFTLSSLGPSSQEEGPPIPHWFLKEPGSSPGGKFAIAWGWDFYGSSFLNYRNQMMQDGVINILGNPADLNSYDLVPPLNVPYAGTSFRYDSEAQKRTLLADLKQSSCFFWLGHGSYNAIAGNTKKSNISPGDVQLTLGNYSFQSSPQHPKQDQHPFKLVVLNGCEAYISLWAGAFGIDFSSQTSTNVVLEYQFTGRMPRAFVAWTNEVLIPSGGDVTGLGHAEFGNALARLWSDWMSGYPLDFCVDDFAFTAVDYGYTDQDSWRISGCIDLTRWN